MTTAQGRRQFTPWTDSGEDRLLVEADQLADAIRTYARQIVAAKLSKDVTLVFAAADALLPIVAAYCQAQLEFTGTAYPFDCVGLDDDEDDPGDDRGDPKDHPLTISVRCRYDYDVPDAELVVAAAQRIRDADLNESRQVGHLGEAVHELIHSQGRAIPALDLPELKALAGFMFVYETHSPLTGEDMGFDIDRASLLLPVDDADRLIFTCGEQPPRGHTGPQFQSSGLFRMSRDPNQDDDDLRAAIYAESAGTNHSRRRFSQVWKTIKRHDR